MSSHSRARIEWNTPGKEERKLDSFLGLGGVAVGLKDALDKTKNLLETHGTIVAPEGWCILVQPRGDETPLMIEKFFPATDDKPGCFSQHFEEETEEIMGVGKGPHDHLAFIGKSIDYDPAVRGFYIYHASGLTRVLHRSDHYSMVSMSSLETAERQFPTALIS